jgi:uncharacterized membrane protein
MGQINLIKTLHLTATFYICYLAITNFDYMVDYNLTINNHLHGSTTNLWSNNEQSILWILIVQYMGTLEP